MSILSKSDQFDGAVEVSDIDGCVNYDRHQSVKETYWTADNHPDRSDLQCLMDFVDYIGCEDHNHSCHHHVVGKTRYADTKLLHIDKVKLIDKKHAIFAN